MRIKLFPVLLLTAFWVGCGGGSSSTTSNAPTTPPPSGGTSNSGGSLTAPQEVAVTNGQTTSGINIVVPNTASAFNITLLGVNSPSATTISASNVGGAVARGSTATILIFGPGLTGSETLSLSGPNDVSITGEKGVKSTDGTPGIQFQVTVGGNAAIGARTLSVKQGSNAAAFVGGIEVF